MESSNYYRKAFEKHEMGSIFISWNWGAFFFGWLWLAYKGMYAYALMFLALSMTMPLLMIGGYINMEMPYYLENILTYTPTILLTLYGTSLYGII